MKKRIVKNPDVRRLEIIHVAEELFTKKGYEKTTVEAIIKKAGIAKGTFYYYFKAKKDILEAIVLQISEGMETYFASVAQQSNLTAIQKFKRMIRGPEKKKLTSSSAMKIIHKPENRELQEKLNIQAIETIAPLIASVLEQGKAEGVFSQAPSTELVQLILAGSQFVLDSGLFPWTAKKRIVYLKELQNLFETLVGIESGALGFISKE